MIDPVEAQPYPLAVGKAQDVLADMVERHQDGVYGLCLAWLRSPHAAEDMAQETFLRAYRSYRQYDPSRSLLTWLLAIAAHLCSDYLRGKKRKKRQERELRALSVESVAPDRTVEDREQIEFLLRILDDRKRVVYVLHYQHGHSCGEIGTILDIKRSTVKTLLRRAQIELARAHCGIREGT